VETQITMVSKSKQVQEEQMNKTIKTYLWIAGIAVVVLLMVKGCQSCSCSGDKEEEKKEAQVVGQKLTENSGPKIDYNVSQDIEQEVDLKGEKEIESKLAATAPVSSYSAEAGKNEVGLEDRKDKLSERVVLLRAEKNKNELDRALFSAARYGSYDELKVLIDAGANPNMGLAPAIRFKKRQNLKVLIEAGADVNHKDEDNGDTPLMKSYFDLTTIKILLSAGAEVNAKNAIGETALLQAVKGRQHSGDCLEIVRELIKAGADVNVRGRYGVTPLMAAAGSVGWGINEKCDQVRNNEAIIIEELIKAGAKVNARDDNYRTALSKTLHSANENKLQALINAGADVNVKVDDIKTKHPPPLLLAAIECGDVKLAVILIEAGADVDRPDRLGQTAIMIASKQENLEDIAKLILSKKPDLKIKDNSDKTVLMHAAYGGSPNIIKSIISEGIIDINANDQDGKTALIYAAKSGNSAAVGILLDEGAIKDIIDNKGQTALTYAAIKRHPEIVKMLKQ